MTIENPGESFAVLLEQFAALDIKEVSTVLAKGLSQPRTDIARSLRRSPGLPFEQLARARGEQICALLAEAGVAARLVPPVPLRLRPLRVEGATLDEHELELRRPGAPPLRLSWEATEIMVLSAAVLLHEAPGPASAIETEPADSVELLAAAYKRGTNRSDWNAAARARVATYLAESRGAPGQRLEILADLVITNGEIFRISSDAFEFRCLGEGVASSSRSNMERLIVLLDARIAAEACRGDGWRAAARGELAQAACESLEEYESWLRWRVTIGTVPGAVNGC